MSSLLQSDCLDVSGITNTPRLVETKFPKRDISRELRQYLLHVRRRVQC